MTFILWAVHLASGIPSLTEHVDWVPLLLGGWW